MKKLLPLLTALLFLTGCARNYVVTMINGQRYSATSKPRLDHGFYRFTDPSGKQQSIYSGQVREIIPASMVNEDSKQFKFLPSK